ncbi:MAG: glycosyltransferase family 4 protein [Planctomycetes bacterium]|nr:glycosyltransferase family 4 protein [Planctomycetota bacterium]
MTHVIILRDGFYPPDIRIDHQIESLRKAGYDITVIAQKRTSAEKDFEEIENCKVRRFELLRLSRIGSLRLLWSGFHSGIYDFSAKVVRETKADVVSVVDLPRLPVALALKKSLGVKVIYDRWENYPEAIRALDVKGRAGSTFERMYNEYSRWLKLEAKCVPRCDGILAVIDESRDDLLSRYEIDPARVMVVGNFPDPELFSEDAEPSGGFELPFPRKAHTIVFTGGFGIHRGLEGLMRAFKLASAGRDDMFLAILGRGVNENELRDLRKSLEIEEKSFIGLVKHHEVPLVTAAATVMAVPHRKNPHTDTTIPWKLFQAMLMKKPVLAGNAIPIERIVNETRCGFVGNSDRPDTLAKALEKLLDKNVAQECSESGFRAFTEKYNWQAAEANLLRLYSNLISGG